MWPHIIEGILFPHRVSRHSLTKYSPFMMMYNRKPVTILPNDNFKFPVCCKFEGLVEMRFVWKDPASKILFYFNTFSTSFVTHLLRTFIISNANCTYYACYFSKYRRISYNVFALIFMRIGLIFQRQKMGAVKKCKKEKQPITFLCNLNKLPLL